MKWWAFVIFVFLSLSYSLSFNLIYSIGDIAPLTTLEGTALYADGWQASETWRHWRCCDNQHWIQQSESVGSAIAPFRYRVTIPAMVHLIPLPAPFAWQVWNITMITLLGSGMVAYLMYFYQHGRGMALLGGFMVVTTVTITRTALVPSVDISAMVLMLALLACVQAQRMLAFIGVAIVAVLTKEVFILAAPLWWVHTRFGWKWTIGLIPLAAFVLIRLILGGSALEINYGYDATNSAQLADALHYARLDPVSLGNFLITVFMSLGYLWIGFPLAVLSDRYTMRRVIVVTTLTVIAVFLLSSQVQRNMGIIAVVLIPPLLNAIQTPKTLLSGQDSV
jgi:hypothetical protein